MSETTLIPKSVKRNNTRKARATLMPLCVAIELFFSEYKRYRIATKKEIDVPNCLKRIREVTNMGDYTCAANLVLEFPFERELTASIERNKTILRTNTTFELQDLIAKMEKVLAVYKSKKRSFQILTDKIQQSNANELDKYFQPRTVV